MNRFFLASLLLLGACWLSPANAVTCFWVGGTASWDGTNTGGGGTGGIKWASATGGGTTCAGGGTGGSPGSADTATFDGSSGGGTVTTNTTINITSLVTSAFTGTIDFSANNNNITTQVWTDAGTGTHTINMGSGTWTVNNSGTGGGNAVAISGSNLTLSAGTSTLALNQTAATNGNVTWALGGKTWATVTFAATGAPGQNVLSGANTFGHLNITAPFNLQLPASTTQTVSNAYTWTGTSTQPIFLDSSSFTAAATISTPATSGGTWIVVRHITGSSNTPVFTNCVTLGQTSNVTCNAPNVVAGGGGPPVFGG
jgi:hypothetical protein